MYTDTSHYLDNSNIQGSPTYIQPNRNLTPQTPSSPFSWNGNHTHEYKEILYEEIKVEERSIGSGAFGVVYRGTWRGAVVAVKKLALVDQDDLLAQDVQREADMIHRVGHHPNIVRFYGACTRKSPYCLVTELYPRGSVFSLLRTQPLDWRTLVGFARDAAAGILHLHCEDVIHRDIATRNLLVDDMWNVRVSDFGLARIKIKATTSTKSNIGPVKWMAPEALREKIYSPKSDSYSFGVLLWELATKMEPYGDMDLINIAIAVINENLRPVIPEETPKVFVDLMTRCWETDPELRPDFQEMFEILQKYYEQLPVNTLSANGSGTFPTSPNTTSRNSVSTNPLSVPAVVGSPRTSAYETSLELNCPICSQVFTEVVETACCHRCFCIGCVKQWINSTHSCPACHAPLSLDRIAPNVPLQRLIDNIPAECPYTVNGCSDRITRATIVRHVEKCPYAEVECELNVAASNEVEAQERSSYVRGHSRTDSATTSTRSTIDSLSTSSPGLDGHSPGGRPRASSNPGEQHVRVRSSPLLSLSAGVETTSVGLSPKRRNAPCFKSCGQFLRKDLERHQREDCPYRFVVCDEGCGAQVRFCLAATHAQKCPLMPLECPHECGQLLMRADLESHFSSCLMQPVKCKYVGWGCEAMIPRQILEKHYEDNSQHHLDLAEIQLSRQDELYEELNKSKADVYDRLARSLAENARLNDTLQDLLALKPVLPYNPLRDFSFILPSCILAPESSVEAMSLITCDQNTRTFSYHFNHSPKFFSTKTASGKPVQMRSDRLIPISGITFYFEVTIKSIGKDGSVGVGLSAPGYELYSMPGWHQQSYGYHGDDGRKFGAGSYQFGLPYGPIWCKDDIVGCGWDQSLQKLFYTLNGKFLGVAFDGITGTYYASVGMHTHGARIKANFGQEPFKFNIDDYQGC